MMRHRSATKASGDIEFISDDRRAGRRRSCHRIPVDALVTLNADSRGIEATVCDVSEGGLRIALHGPPPPGPITVKMVGFPIFAGEVRWRDSDHIGVELGQPISTDILAAWVRVHGKRS